MTSFAVGSLVRARGREWVVLPESEPELLVLRPLGGTEDEITGIYVGKGADGKPFEAVQSATFALPDPARDLGNHLSSGLLRDAVRLGFRSAAGPFRSLARIAVEPRPYQLVPLLMALKLDPVRLLIADDVGVGKTVEACLIARELLDRGEVQRMAVLCPPHLAEQWQKALREQFHLDAALVLSGTVARLERDCAGGQSVFERHHVTVVSTDYIKQERRRHEFLRTAPELVLVDEAHTCADGGGKGAAQQRHALLQELVKDPTRHLLLITATPHSGKPETFRSLLALLDPGFAALPEDLGGEVNRKHREALARHLVQRRRGDILAYQGAATRFPRRVTAEEHYGLRPDYRRFFDRVLSYCRETVRDTSVDRRRQRVRWWSALALLRSIASSPAAAAATLRNRSGAADAESDRDVDEAGRRAVLDLDDESAEGIDVVPGAGEDEDEGSAERRRLRDLAREAEQLAGKGDAKLERATELIAGLVAEGSLPIVFCRFIPTVDYVAEALRKKLPKDVTVEAVTGVLPAEERENRVTELEKHPKRVLVCTDCLSEGINLQHLFDTVFHYDLSWNPTRHEQREGRVDRYGQDRETVRALTFYGKDNPVDGIVLEVLLRKHKSIRDQLGVAVPVPMDTEVVEEVLKEGLLMRDARAGAQLSLDFPRPKHMAFDVQWNAAVEREKKSRAVFAQHQIQKAIDEEIARELDEVQRAIGGEADVERFTLAALRGLGAVVSGKHPYEVDVRECRAAARDAMGEEKGFRAAFRGHASEGTLLLTRTHPVVEGLAAHVLETALDPALEGIARRAGVVRTRAVQKRTALLLARLRFHILGRDRHDHERRLLAEDLALAAFTGSPESPAWLPLDAAEPLLEAEPHANVPADAARVQIERVLAGFDALRPRLAEIAKARGKALLDAHRRVRKVAKGGDRTLGIEAHDAVDVLGVFVYLPADIAGAL
ncbi:hypothetical protein BE08_33020 [Sorangium cellulosum]|uniref:ATP-dependent helicase n=1 Tax=Sorangium cellulosum TaxID=56 RepID=A0A150P270_SORCE|nr:hypothetical protein BE08_33020 [Sorangium cellulosum]